VGQCRQANQAIAEKATPRQDRAAQDFTREGSGCLAGFGEAGCEAAGRTAKVKSLASVFKAE
jgi:hypothetical protein